MRAIPSLARLLTADAAPRSTFQRILTECPDANIYSGTHILPDSCTYTDLYPEDSSSATPSNLLDGYQHHGSIRDIDAAGRYSAIPCLADYPPDDIAALLRHHYLPPTSPVVALLVESRLLPLLDDDPSLVPVALQPEPSPNITARSLSPEPLPRDASAQPDTPESHHPPPSPPRHTLSPAPLPEPRTLAAAVLAQYPDACDDTRFFLESAKGSKGNLAGYDRPPFGTAYAAYSALRTLDSVAAGMGLDPRTPSRTRHVTLDGDTFDVTYYQLALALGFTVGTLKNYKTQVGLLPAVLARVAEDPSPSANVLQRQLQLFIDGHARHPEEENDHVFRKWRMQDLVQALRPYRSRSQS